MLPPEPGCARREAYCEKKGVAPRREWAACVPVCRGLRPQERHGEPGVSPRSLPLDVRRKNPHNRPRCPHSSGRPRKRVANGEGLSARDASRTVGWLAVRDITDEVTEAVKESGVDDGIACVYSPHTTCCVRVNEFESGSWRTSASAQGLCRARPTTRTTTGTGAPRTSAPRTWTRATGTRTAWRCCSGRRASRSRCATASSGSGLAARALPRARPRARPSLDRPGRRHLNRPPEPE